MRRLLALAGAIGLAIAAPAHARSFSAGAPGLGDPFFPLAGNGGYDVSHYALTLDYRRAGNRLSAAALISARATQGLSSFDLDLRGFDVARVTVDHRPARFTRSGQELTVVPPFPLHRGQPFAVFVRYTGSPQPVIDPDGSLDGWIPTPDGAFVASEPQGAPSWFPADDNPRDKARFDFAITVPRGITAIANGRLVSRHTHADRTTWRWHEDAPMATYLATATNGVFDLRVRHFGRLPLYQAADPAEAANGALGQLAAEAGVLRFFSRVYGRYPFSSGGGVVDHAPDVGYFLESQTRVQYAGTPDLDGLVHELSHQWFGDAVSLSVWPDIWLNEGFATFSQWYYDERHGGPTAQAAFDQVYATPADDPFWGSAPAALPGPELLFSDPVYARGAATLQALREKIGDRSFFAILRSWYARYRYGNATTRDFIALAEAVSRQPLAHFFDVWLYEPGKPSGW